MATLSREFRKKMVALLTAEDSLSTVEAIRFGDAADEDDPHPYILIPELPLELDETWSADVFALPLEVTVYSKTTTAQESDDLGEGVETALRRVSFTLTVGGASWKAVAFELVGSNQFSMHASERAGGKVWVRQTHFSVRLEQIS